MTLEVNFSDPSSAPKNETQSQTKTSNTFEQHSNKEQKVMSNPLYELISQANLISSTHSISEVSDIIKSIEDNVKLLDKNTASEAQKLSLPRSISQMTSDITPQLPGIVLSTVIGSQCYAMPVLFFKSGVTELTESIFLANETMPRGIAKVATSFMTRELMEKVKTAYGVRNGKQMNGVSIVSPIVINLEAFIKNSVKPEDMVADVRNVLMKEWGTGLINMVCLDIAKDGVKMPSVFKEGKVYGKDSAAVARVEPVNSLTIDGRPTPYNLSVKLSTTNKNNTQNVNSTNTRTIANTYMTVALESMSMGQFQQARAARPGQPVGPLVPVISTGLTIPGETLNNNNSMVTAILGLYASIGANQMQFFSEAFRGKEVGHRGNIGNFNHYLSTMLQGLYTTQNFITDKNVTNAAVVNDWLGRYVAPNAVYVLDLASYSEDVSNSDFWWNLIFAKPGSTYHKALMNICDSLTGGRFSEIANANLAKGRDRNPRAEWAPGDAVLTPTSIMLPTGIAQGKDGKWFDLGEVDGMYLRQENAYGQNEAAVNEYMALTGGQSGGDPKVRQFNIYNRLQTLFSSNVIIDGWKRRCIWSDAFFRTLSEAMGAAGTVSMSSSNTVALWNMQYSNDYLTNTITAGIHSSTQPGGMTLNGGYSQY